MIGCEWQRIEGSDDGPPPEVVGRRAAALESFILLQMKIC